MTHMTNPLKIVRPSIPDIKAEPFRGFFLSDSATLTPIRQSSCSNPSLDQITEETQKDHCNHSHDQESRDQHPRLCKQENICKEGI